MKDFLRRLETISPREDIDSVPSHASRPCIGKVTIRIKVSIMNTNFYQEINEGCVDSAVIIEDDEAISPTSQVLPDHESHSNTCVVVPQPQGEADNLGTRNIRESPSLRFHIIPTTAISRQNVVTTVSMEI
jgi:hypothetical protein